MYAFRIFLLLISAGIHAQTWQSINHSQYSTTVPWGQFIINQYTNELWLVNDNKVTVLENNGDRQLFDYNHLGILWTGAHLRFAFMPDSIFYMKESMGLFSFNNYLSSLLYSETTIGEFTSNSVKVHTLRSGSVLEYADVVSN